jgi:hypothetical protein
VPSPFTLYSPVVTSIECPSSRVTIARLVSLSSAPDILECLLLALAHVRVDSLHLHIEQPLDRRLDLGLGGVARHLEDHLVVLRDQRRLLGDDGARITSWASFFFFVI